VVGAIAATNVVFVSSSEITATTGGPAIAGSFSVLVTQNDGVTNVGGADFTYTPVGAAPSVTNVSPNTGPIDGGTAITMTGTGFTSPATVVIGQGYGTNRAVRATNVDVVSSTEITATTGESSKAGTFSPYVNTSGGTSAASAGSNFTYTPTVTSVIPNKGPSSGGTNITINGTGFQSPATVVIGQGNGTTGAIAATNVEVIAPDTEIRATAGGGARAGTFSVFVTTQGVTTAASNAAHFSYTPTVTSVSPNTGPTSGGTTITIMGSGFQSPATVVIGQRNGSTGAIAATNVDVISKSEITATTGGGATAGTFSVFVTTQGVTSPGSFGAHFTYTG
jgi:hypothetical protein